MSEAIAVAIIVATPGVMTAAISLLAARKLHKVYLMMNGRLDKLVTVLELREMKNTAVEPPWTISSATQPEANKK